MCADKDNLGQVFVQMKGCRRRKPVACGDVVEACAAIPYQHRGDTISASETACVEAIAILQVRQQKFQLIFASQFPQRDGVSVR